MLLVPGYVIGIIELLLFFLLTFYLKKMVPSFTKINCVAYYWVMMTVLTGLWEASFIHNYKSISLYGRTLIANNTHVWTNKYDLSYVMPNKLAYIFYAEYGAHADREYLSLTDNWSHSIEGSHAVFCALFAMLAFTFVRLNNYNNYLVTLSVSMGTQVMNSILYMDNYFIQTLDPNSPNYNSHDFPTGRFLGKRLFMWVNIFWMVMPTGTILYLMFNNKKKLKAFYKYTRYNKLQNDDDDIEAYKPMID